MGLCSPNPGTRVTPLMWPPMTNYGIWKIKTRSRKKGWKRPICWNGLQQISGWTLGRWRIPDTPLKPLWRKTKPCLIWCKMPLMKPCAKPNNCSFFMTIAEAWPWKISIPWKRICLLTLKRLKILIIVQALMNRPITKSSWPSTTKPPENGNCILPRTAETWTNGVFSNTLNKFRAPPEPPPKLMPCWAYTIRKPGSWL